LHGRQVLDHWQQLAQQGDWTTLVERLLTEHYDPAYLRSTSNNFSQLKNAKILHLERLDEEALRSAAPLAL
jgi:tRNA 2-selenouridine synthase